MRIGRYVPWISTTPVDSPDRSATAPLVSTGIAFIFAGSVILTNPAYLAPPVTPNTTQPIEVPLSYTNPHLQGSVYITPWVKDPPLFTSPPNAAPWVVIDINGAPNREGRVNNQSWAKESNNVLRATLLVQSSGNKFYSGQVTPILSTRDQGLDHNHNSIFRFAPGTTAPYLDGRLFIVPWNKDVPDPNGRFPVRNNFGGQPTSLYPQGSVYLQQDRDFDSVAQGRRQAYFKYVPFIPTGYQYHRGSLWTYFVLDMPGPQPDRVTRGPILSATHSSAFYPQGSTWRSYIDSPTIEKSNALTMVDSVTNISLLSGSAQISRGLGDANRSWGNFSRDNYRLSLYGSVIQIPHILSETYKTQITKPIVIDCYKLPVLEGRTWFSRVINVPSTPSQPLDLVFVVANPPHLGGYISRTYSPKDNSIAPVIQVDHDYFIDPLTIKWVIDNYLEWSIGDVVSRWILGDPIC